MKTAEQTIFEMLVENTGQAMCDSGDAYGRNWEHNQGKTLDVYKNEPEVKLDFYEGIAGGYTISVFHYLTKQLEIDEICQKFNDINTKADNWDGEIHGVSKEAEEYLITIGLPYTFDGEKHIKCEGGFNSCNGESSLSQVIQGTYVTFAEDAYIVLQIHGGCDVRGGYTDARLFKLDSEYAYVPCLAPEDVYGTITPKDADIDTPALPGCETVVQSDIIQFSNTYDGYSLRIDDSDEEIEIKETDNVSLGLCIW